MSSHAQQAQTLVEALPYIQKFTGKTIVIKYGGNAMISQDLRQAVMSDIVLLFGEKNGTSSREGLMSCSSAEKMSLMRRSGVV